MASRDGSGHKIFRATLPSSRGGGIQGLEGYFRRGSLTSPEDREQDPNTLESGLIVRDREGVRKRILRTEGETVFWEYLNGDRGANGAGEYSTEYSEFADTHYVVPKAKRSEPAEQGAPEGITKGTIYVNAEGRRVRVMEVGEKIVRWTEVEDDSVGVTPIQEFLKTFRPEGRRPESPSAA